MKKSRPNGAARSRKDGKPDHGRAHRARPTRVEPASFAWVEPLDEIEPIIVEKVVEKVVEKQVVVEKFVEKQVVVEKVVEKQVLVDRPVVFEKVVEKFVEKPDSSGKAARVRFRDAKQAAGAQGSGGQTVIIGRGPSLTERLVRVAPDPKPVLAGACALIIALAGVALISPSGERATAARSTAPLGVAESPSGSTSANIGLTGAENVDPSGKARDPFAAEGYMPKPAAKGKTAGKSAVKKSADTKPRSDTNRKTATPATAKPSLFAANFVTYSSYTPWTKIKRRSGGWVQFGGEPTVKVVSVSEESVELFVVTDVEVLTDKSRAIDYSYPLRIVKVKPGGVVRFADYRDIQGDDVEYTIRFRGSLPINLIPAD